MSSTAISDGVLAFVTLACAVPLVLRSRNPTCTFGAGCFLFIAITAALGAARFAGADVDLFHRSTAWTSRMIAVPMLGFVFLALALEKKVIRPYWYALGLALGAIGWLLPSALGVVPGAAGMMLVLAGAAMLARDDKLGAAVSTAGVVVYVAAGFLIGTKGHYGSVPRVDVFHYALAVAHPAIAFGMVRAAAR